MITSRVPRRLRRQFPVGIATGFLALSAAPLAAQTPTPPPALPAAPALAAPTSPIAAPAVPAAPAPSRILTLDQVLAIALNNNSTVQLAREKVYKAQQLIAQADAGGLPQVRVDLVDTLSSNRTFGTGAGGGNATGTLPGGGQIPVIIDQGGGNAGTFVGGGGGGTGVSNGTNTSFGTTTASPSSGSGGGFTSGSGVGNGTFGTGGTQGLGGAGNLGTGTGTNGLGTENGTGIGTGTGGTLGTGTTGGGVTGGGNFGTTGPTVNPGGTGTGGGTAAPRVRSDGLNTSDLPPVMQQYVEKTTSKSVSAAPRADTGTGSGSGDGTGTTPGNGTGFSNTSNGGKFNNYSARLSVTQGIDIFNLVPAARDVERITRDFYQTDLDRIANETALSVKNTFFNVLRDQAQVNVYEQQVTADIESVRVTQARVTAGAAAQFDLLTAQTTLSNAQQQLSAARNTLTLAQANLNNLLGINQDTPIGLQDPPLPPINQTFNRQQLAQTALSRRPELRQADNNLLIAQRLIKLAGASLLPSLSIVGSGNYNGNVSGSSPHSTVSLSAVLGIPLFDGGGTKARVRSAQSDLRTQQITRGQLLQNVDLEIRQALSNVNDAQTRAGSAGQGATQAAEALRLANVRYQNGIGTILDVVNAQAQLAQARTNLLNAQYDYQTSLAQLSRAIGGR